MEKVIVKLEAVKIKLAQMDYPETIEAVDVIDEVIAELYSKNETVAMKTSSGPFDPPPAVPGKGK